MLDEMLKRLMYVQRKSYHCSLSNRVKNDYGFIYSTFTKKGQKVF